MSFGGGGDRGVPRGRRGAVGLKGNKRLKDYKLDIWICDKEDKLELLETMVFSLMIVSSWETIATFMKHGYTDVLYGSSILSVGPITVIGFICAIEFPEHVLVPANKEANERQ